VNKIQLEFLVRAHGVFIGGHLSTPLAVVKVLKKLGLRFHSDEARVTEVAIAAQVLNRMLDLGRPNSVRVA